MSDVEILSFEQIIDGESVTALRTGLVSAVATKVSKGIISSLKV